jgi:hypothetical protein
MLLLDDARVEERRRAASGPLTPLYESLVTDLEPLLGRDVYIPEAKALLSRAGGRCEIDGAVLDFDPWSPQEHRCPTCGTIHKGELHHRAWITSYQLWLAERSVHAALFHLFRGDARHAALARDILRAYADRYLKYPNRDNVLGPTRLFFSTYLESIWLLQICVAADLLARAGDDATAELVRDRIVEPSSALIAEYDEGMSNRQVWNNAAMLASAALRGERRGLERLREGDSSEDSHLSRALLGDGTWYEGENYHQFALRGLWYGVTLCESAGHEIKSELRDRFHRAFVAPFLTALPDFTMPSRKDSQYAVSLRQWRIAELTELGFARHRNPLLAGALARCYESGHERRDTGRARSTADVERNGPPASLTRADLGWRALLHALPELPSLPALAPSPRSALLEEQGIAVFRRAGDVYVALDYGQSGGGHGHPDRLNVLLSHGVTRWLDDLGTGSYVDPSLHWYRSTLAHNAPLIGGRSQPMRDGTLRAYDEREGLGWVGAETFFPDNDVRLERTLLVAPDYVLDELRWSAPGPVRIELPWHLDGTITVARLEPATLDGGDGEVPEDGFSFVRDTRAARISANSQIELATRVDGRSLRATFVADCDVTLYSACAPGQPATVLRPFYIMRAESGHGAFRSLLSWSSHVQHARFDQHSVTVELDRGERHVHRRDEAGWHVELFAGAARSSVDLAGWREIADDRQQPLPAARNPTVLRRSRPPQAWLSELSKADRTQLLTFELGEEHYRRSEDRWSDAGSPRATIAVAAGDRALSVYADVRAGERRFATSEASNPFDNEHADTMGAGLQLYLRTPDGSGAWALIPESAGDVVRVRPIAGWGALARPHARWRERDAGYEMRVEIPLLEIGDEYPIDVDIIVNETTSARERRRGQLVLSGGQGEFVYLRGDRHDPTRLIPLVLVS